MTTTAIPEATQAPVPSPPRLRRLTQDEQAALAQRLRRAWASLVEHGNPSTPSTSLLSSFGPWSRVAAPVDEVRHHLVCVLYRNRHSDEFALLKFPSAFCDPDEDATAAAVEAMIDASKVALVGGFLHLWEWTLNGPQPMLEAAMLFVNRLPKMSPEVQFLSAFTLIDRTFALIAPHRREALTPAHSTVQTLVDRIFWDEPESVRTQATQEAMDEAVRFLAACSNRVMTQNFDTVRLEVEHHMEAFLNNQRDHDREPSGQCRPRLRHTTG